MFLLTFHVTVHDSRYERILLERILTVYDRLLFVSMGDVDLLHPPRELAQRRHRMRHPEGQECHGQTAKTGARVLCDRYGPRVGLVYLPPPLFSMRPKLGKYVYRHVRVIMPSSFLTTTH